MKVIVKSTIPLSKEYKTDMVYTIMFLSSMWDGLQNESVAGTFYKTSSSEIIAASAYASMALLEDDDSIEEFGHQKTDMITSCVFSGQQCSPA